jgi:molybdenum cofactor biosynthesis protein B
MTVPDEHRRQAAAALGLAVLTVSDTRTAASDASGERIAALAAAGGHQVVERRLVPDEAAAIRGEAEALLAQPQVEVLVVTGGTGYSRRDVTVEALRPLFEREIDGFGELFRALSFAEVGAAAMLSRATAGLVGGKAVYLLPGSTPAVELAMERLILPESGHLLGQVRRGKA